MKKTLILLTALFLTLNITSADTYIPVAEEGSSLSYVSGSGDMVATNLTAVDLDGGDLGDFDGDGRKEMYWDYNLVDASGERNEIDLISINTGFGDIDGDGTEDFVFTGGPIEGPEKLKYLSGGEKHTISNAQTLEPFGGIADFDGDGKEEVAMRRNDKLAFAGENGVEKETGIRTDEIGGAGDLDGDGRAEVAVLKRMQSASNLIAVDYSGEITSTEAEYVESSDADPENYRRSGYQNEFEDRGEIIYGIGPVVDFDGDGTSGVVYTTLENNLKYHTANNETRVLATGISVPGLGTVEVDSTGQLPAPRSANLTYEGGERQESEGQKTEEQSQGLISGLFSVISVIF